MRIRLSSDVIKDLRKIKKKNRRLLKRIEKQLVLFQNNPRHPSLRTHKLTGKLQNLWSISVTKDIRMVYILLTKDEAYNKRGKTPSVSSGVKRYNSRAEGTHKAFQKCHGCEPVDFYFIDIGTHDEVYKK